MNETNVKQKVFTRKPIHIPKKSETNCVVVALCDAMSIMENGTLQDDLMVSSLRSSFEEYLGEVLKRREN